MRLLRQRGNVIRILLAIFVLGATIGLFGYVLISGIFGINKSMLKFEGPGSATLDLKKGGYMIFYEYSLSERGGNLPPYTMRIEDARNGSEIPLRRATTNSRYTFGDRRGYAVFNFQAPESGKYNFSMKYNDDRQEPRAVFAVSGGFVEKLLLTILLCFVIMFGGIVLFVLLIKGKRRTLP